MKHKEDERVGSQEEVKACRMNNKKGKRRMKERKNIRQQNR
jgi:hypothetical protein